MRRVPIVRPLLVIGVGTATMLNACSGDDSSPAASDTTPSTVTTAVTVVPPAPPGYDYCVACHAESGEGVGPFPAFADIESGRTTAARIALVTHGDSSLELPHPGFSEQLSAEEIRRLVEYAERLAQT